MDRLTAARTLPWQQTVFLALIAVAVFAVPIAADLRASDLHLVVAAVVLVVAVAVSAWLTLAPGRIATTGDEADIVGAPATGETVSTGQPEKTGQRPLL